MGSLRRVIANIASVVYSLFFFLNVVKNKRLRRMLTTLLLGLSLCSMVASCGTESRIAKVESEIKEVKAGIAEVKSGIADLKSLISKLAGSGNGDNASLQEKGHCQGACQRNASHCTDGGVCFYVFEEEKTWEEARRICQGLGEDLATFSSLAETKSLQEYLKKIKSSDEYLTKKSAGAFWIGSKKEKTDGRNPGNWKWITGEPVPTDGTVGKWNGDSARAKGAYCMIVHNKSKYDYDFCNFQCSDKLSYVCSKTK